MNNCMIWAKRLNILLENNFSVARCYKKSADFLDDTPLRNYFLKMASRRSQFAFELHREINYLNCSSYPLHPLSYSRPGIKTSSDGDPFRLIKNCMKNDQYNLQEYGQALSAINNGSSREILIRHKSQIERTITGLKKLKLEFKLQDGSENLLRNVK